ncbi:DUF551 domain-containing protein [Kaistia sp. MMO-174]|uniref:DUF551 domain-containing protein n=1 Tax=Kaistia sp. MMO-174 TaxID=3081256 RepID=UPI00301987F9
MSNTFLFKDDESVSPEMQAAIDRTNEAIHSRMDEALRRAVVTVRRNSWRPISSAPTSGDVLLYFPLEGLSKTHPNVVIGHRHEEGFWVFQGRAFRGYSDAYQPTHWQPLPDPPE